jgi:hypothetical protein
MPRPDSRLLASPLIFGSVCAVLGLVSIVPILGRGWTGWLNAGLTFLVAPVQEPLYKVVSSFHSGPAKASDARLVALEQEAARWKTLYLREQLDRERLEGQITQLQRGMRLNPDQNVRQLVDVPVIGKGSDLDSNLLTVRAGTSDGVQLPAVATVDAVNLVGRIESPSAKLCYLRPINDPKAGQIMGVIFPGELTGDIAPDRSSPRLACKLNPTRNGTLVGDVEVRRNQNAPGTTPIAPVQPGMLVRLEDTNWPRESFMLIIGRIKSVERAPNGRDRIVVTPMFDSQPAEVTLRFREGNDDAPITPPPTRGRP